MSRLRRPLTKNFHLSLTGKEPVLNNFTLYNYFPMGLMIISKVDITSFSRNEDSNSSSKNNDNEDIKIKFINQQASELFEIKENDDSKKIHLQLKEFKQYEKVHTKEENLDHILFNKNNEEQFYGSFKSNASLIFVKSKCINDDYYICADYYTDERKVIQNQLFQSLKFQYIATLFHELYNPLNALMFMVEPNQDDDENKDEINKSNLGNVNHLSEIDDTHFSIITENDLDKNNPNCDNENISLKKNRKIEELYKNKLTDLKEKEKDISLLANMIYIFLENLILYLRINLGVDFNKNEKKKEEESEHSSKDDNNDNMANNVYKDNYLSQVNKNKRLNLEFSFYKHLNKFSYLFKFKDIQYCNDFSYLSNKYILTDESLFSEFLGQIYTFLYYVVPKSKGFDLTYNLIGDDKIKIMFQKANFPNKVGFRFKKMRKNNSSIICQDKFNATSTVKTPEMIQEILYKLAGALGIKLKIMEYEDMKEDIYLAIIMPYFIDEDNDLLDSDINELSEENLGNIPYLSEVVGRNILYSDNNEKSELEDMKINIENNIVKNLPKTKSLKLKSEKNNTNTKSKSPNNLTLNFYKISPERKASFLVEQVEERNSSEEDISSEKEEVKDNKSNDKIMEKSSSKSKSNSSKNKEVIQLAPFSKKISIDKAKSPPISDHNIIGNNNFKDISNEISPILTQYENDNSKDISYIKENDKKKNILTLIHERYSLIDKLKAGGVEIMMENDKKNTNKDENNNKGLLSSVRSNNDFHHKKSLDVESDETENFIEIENDFNFDDLENELNNNFMSINQTTNNIKCNNSISINKSYLNSTSLNINNKIKNKASIKPSCNSLNNNNITTNDSINIIQESNQALYKFSNNALKETIVNKETDINKDDKKNQNSPIESICNCNCKDILLVDDDEFILKTSKNILKKFKLEADSAENGQECLNKIKDKINKNCSCSKNKYKIVLMDITMPVMDGIEAAKNIQKMINEGQLYDTIKIIFISAHMNLDLTSITSEIKCALDYYAKPINVAKYKALLDKYYYSK